MYDHSIKKFGKLTVGATLVLALGGCGGDSDNSTSIQGTAMAGPFLTGTVCAYKVSNGAKAEAIGSCSVIASATSSFTLNVGDYVGDVLLEINNATYDDEANPNDNVIGTPLTGPMRSLIHIASVGDTVNVAITPLTEAALRMAGGTLNNATVQAAVDQLESLLQTGSSLDLRTTLPLAQSPEGMAYREALRALSELQWGTSGAGDFVGDLSGFLGNLVGQIGNNSESLATQLRNQINANLDSNCSTSSGALVCTVPSDNSSGGTGNTGGTDTSGGTGNGGTDTSGGTDNGGGSGGGGGAAAAAACSSEAVPAGMNYSVNGNNITVTTTGCITLPTAGMCVPEAPAQATGINILQTSTAGSASLSGLTFNIPGDNNPFGDIGSAYASGKTCLKNAPDGMSNWNISYNVCYDITSQVAPALAAIPAGMVTVANQITIAANGATTMQTVADCFTTGADSITDALTGEIWAKQADGSYLKLN